MDGREPRGGEGIFEMEAHELLEGSRHLDAAIPAGRSKAKTSRTGHFLYAVYFLPIFFAVRLITALLLLSRFNRLVARVHRLLRIRKRILFLEVFFPENAGYHYRTQKWIEILNQNKLYAGAKYVLERERFEQLLRDEKIVLFQTIFLLHRIWQCLTAVSYSCVVVRRELLLYNDYGGLFLDKFLLALHPNVILDFDDDIAAAKREPRSISPFGRLMFESPSKFTDSLKLYAQFIAGTTHLKDLVLKANPGIHEDSVNVIPTCVDYERHPSKMYERNAECINFGWVGSNATMDYLDIVAPALNQIAQRHNIRLIVVGGKDYGPDFDFEVVNVRWSLEKEIENLAKIDIGLMPLYDTAAEKGKCGFKLIQYLGLGIVSIASAVTINEEIIDDKENGFLVHDASEWVSKIEEVLHKTELYPAISAAARKKVFENFSFEAHRHNYVEFIRICCNTM
jgi:glycosyltransferase involved in cell wall biosynthesis